MVFLPGVAGACWMVALVVAAGVTCGVTPDRLTTVLPAWVPLNI